MAVGAATVEGASNGAGAAVAAAVEALKCAPKPPAPRCGAGD